MHKKPEEDDRTEMIQAFRQVQVHMHYKRWP